MQAEIIKEEGLVRIMSLTLPAEKLEQGIQQKISQLKQKVSLAGFRPGKVPENVIRQHYATSLLNEVGGDLMKETFFNLAVARDINLAGIRAIEPKQLAFGKDLIFEVSYELFPEIKINLSPNTKLERVRAEVTEGDVQIMVEAMRESKASLADTVIGVPATRDHVVVIDYHMGDGRRQENLALDLAKDFPSPHFVAALVGMREGDIKPIQDRVRNDKHEERDVTFHVKIRKVQRKILPELDEDFYSQYGIDNAKDFYAQVKKGMQLQLNHTIKRLVRKSVFELLLAEHKELEAPSTQVEREANRLRDQWIDMHQRRTQPNSPLDKEQVPLRTFIAEAKEKVKVGMLLIELAQQNKISITDDQLETRITEMASSYQEPARAEEYYKKNEQAREDLRVGMLEEKVIEHFLTQIKVEDTLLSYSEAMEMAKEPFSFHGPIAIEPKDV